MSIITNLFYFFMKFVCVFPSRNRRFPEQRLTRLEALRGKLNPSTSLLLLQSLIHYSCPNFRSPGMTINPAFASFSESRLGSLEPGKIADYVVLSQDIMEVPEDKILETRVLATVLDGRPAFGEI